MYGYEGTNAEFLELELLHHCQHCDHFGPESCPVRLMCALPNLPAEEVIDLFLEYHDEDDEEYEEACWTCEMWDG